MGYSANGGFRDIYIKLFEQLAGRSSSPSASDVLDTAAIEAIVDKLVGIGERYGLPVRFGKRATPLSLSLPIHFPRRARSFFAACIVQAHSEAYPELPGPQSRRRWASAEVHTRPPTLSSGS